ncbi:MAG: TolC family protein, partial [Myxococcota bacterium]
MALSVRDSVRRLVRENLALKRERLGIAIANADILREQGVFGFDLDLRLDVTHGNEPRGIQNFFSGGQAINVEIFRQGWTLDGDIGLRKRFSLGTVISAVWNHRWSTANTSFLALDDAGVQRSTLIETLTSSFALTLTQPLLKGAWSKANMAMIWHAESNKRKIKAQLAGVVSQYVAQMLLAYWDLHYARANERIQRANIALAEAQRKTTQAFIAAGKKSALELYEAKQAVAKGNLAVLQAIRVKEEAETRCKTLLGMENEASLMLTTAVELTKPLPELKRWLMHVERSSVELMAARQDKRMAELRLGLAKNALLPQLDVTMGFTFLGLGNRVQGIQTDSSPAGRAYGTLFDPRTHTFRGGVVLKIPLDNRQAWSEVQRRQVERRRATLLMQEIRLKLRLELRQLVQIVKRTRQRIPLARVSLELAEKKLEAEKTRYRMGLSTLFQLLQYQQDLAKSRLEVV